ncbi:MAG: 16S rRNA (cytosine(1402)-N(4))-methyltransferase RsmH, partial [Stackebrandtia sp.]
MQQYGAPDKAHVPVFAQRVNDLLAPALAGPAPVCVDATLGAGGHTASLLDANPRLTVIGIDRDPDALELATKRLEHFGDRFKPVRAVYDEVGTVLAEAGVEAIAGALFDLGVSSMQLDVASRGFAYSRDAPLDMRMDQSQGVTAADVVNDYDERDLSRILRVYGEERFAPRIARSIVAQRKRSRIDSSLQLADLVRDAVPAATRRRGGNPSKRTFQALRIAVNSELDVLRQALPRAVDALEPD